MNREISEETVPEPAYNGDTGEKYVACYPYQSAETGDLQFEAGEDVLVVKKDGDWWTGVIGSRTGIFPANYVQPISDNNASVTNGAINNVNTDYNNAANNGSVPDQTSNIMSAEEARNQADADSEVSQINTQNVTNDTNMQDFRGMTASAVSLLVFQSKKNFNNMEFSFEKQSLRAKKGEVATVIAPYEATSSEQLSLQKGQLIMIRKKTDSGWWEGELQVREFIWFKALHFIKYFFM